MTPQRFSAPVEFLFLFFIRSVTFQCAHKKVTPIHANTSK